MMSGYQHLHDAQIMIVDDDVQNLRLFEVALRAEGYRCITLVHNPCEVATLCALAAPDLVVLDLHMPQRDGYLVLADLAPLLADDIYLPVVVITADVSAAARQKVLASGAKDFLVRPVSMLEALLRVKNLLEARMLHLELHRQNQELEARVQARTHELTAAQQEMLRRLARAAEFRDDSTGEHSQRVGLLAVRLAEALGLPEAEVELLRWAAPLHDLGKIGVPDEVMLKPSALSDAERVAMQAHTQIGAKILGGSRFALLRLAEQIALAHHEAWDGSGYPQGLRGEAIPLAARIVALADAYDSMCAARSHRPALTHHDALAQIAAERGRQFDPQVVDAFLRLMGCVEC
jgi:putative two-component system response regulator